MGNCSAKNKKYYQQQLCRLPGEQATMTQFVCVGLKEELEKRLFRFWLEDPFSLSMAKMALRAFQSSKAFKLVHAFYHVGEG